MSARAYSIAKVSFVWAGLNLMKGIAEGTEILIEDTVPEKWTQKSTGVAGVDVVQVRHPSKAVTVKVTIDCESKTYQKVMAIQAADELLLNQIGTAQLADDTTGESETVSSMRLANRPRRRKGWDGSTVELMFIGVSDFTPNLSDKNLVGVGITPANPLG